MINSKIIIIFIILSFLLLLRFVFVFQNTKTYKSGELITLSTLLLSDIDNYSRKPSISLTLPDTFPPERVTIVFPSGVQIHYGQHIETVGTIASKVLDDGRTVYSIYFPKYRIISSPTDMLFTPLYALRKRIIKGFSMNLSDMDSSLLLGIVFGIKENVSSSFSQQLQATGVTHVIAASGMNVTMVAGFLIVFFCRFFTRKVSISLSSLGLILYAIFAGLQSSIVRATLMGMCLFISQLFGKQYKGWYILVLTGYAMLLFSPVLLFDVGFQLSFLSTLGIITIQPLFKNIPFITEDIATTTSAQIATIPIMLVVFGKYSLLSIIINGLVLWTIPPLMILGSLAAFIGLFLPLVETCILICSIPFLWFFEAVVGFFAGLPILLVFSIRSYILIIAYYLLVIAIITYLKTQKSNCKSESQI